jgi:hypothetical protein
LKITFKLDVSLFGLTTFELSNYFQPIQNSEEPRNIIVSQPVKGNKSIEIHLPNLDKEGYRFCFIEVVVIVMDNLDYEYADSSSEGQMRLTYFF